MQKRLHGLQSLKLREKKKKKAIGIFILFSLITILFVMTVYFILHSSFIQIKSISIVGAESISKNDIERIISNTLDGTYIKIIPRSNIFFYPKTEIKKILINKLNYIESVDIKRNGLGAIVVYITEKSPVAMVCDGLRIDNIEENDECFFVDQNGYVFETATTTSPKFIRYYIFESKKDAILGSNFMDSQKFKDLRKFVDGVFSLGITPLGVLVSDNSQYEMYVKRQGEDSEIVIYFDDKVPFEKTLSNLYTFWKNAFSDKKQKATITNTATTTITSNPDFNFINLRFGNNIFYSTK